MTAWADDEDRWRSENDPAYPGYRELHEPVVPLSPEEALREAVAAIEHEQWIEWAGTVAREGLTPERIERWKRYMVPYADLDEPTKDHDRKWADKVLALLSHPRPPERDPLSPQWEDCKVCGGDHWMKDHWNAERAATLAAEQLQVALELDIRDLHGANPAELAQRLIERGWLR